MIYLYAATVVIAVYAITVTGAYIEELKKHRKIVSKAKRLLAEDKNVIGAMQVENRRLATVLDAYRVAANTKIEALGGIK